MSSRSNGVTNVLLISVTTSWVRLSPVCSCSLMRPISSAPSCGKRLKSSTPRRAMSTAFEDARENNLKNSLRSGVKRIRTAGCLSERGGEGARHGQRAAGRGGRLDRPARGDDHVLDDRQAEPGASGRAPTIHAVEALEQARKLVLGDAGAAVRDDQPPPRPVVAARDRAGHARAGVADRVLDEV